MAVTGEQVHIVGSGRTDAGAHAFGQVVAFSTESSLPTDALVRAFNAHLPSDIAVTTVADVSASFHPRFDARSRTYRYLIWNRRVRSPFYRDRATHVRTPLDESAMDQALRGLIGQHDVSAFVPVQHEGSRDRVIFRSGCTRDGDLVVVEIEASGFLRQMVRAIVGTVIRVGTGHLSPDGFQAILKSKRRELAGDTAPSRGLYLVSVAYPDGSAIKTPPTSDGDVPAGSAMPAGYEEKQ